jgi:hypothetical protein
MTMPPQKIEEGLLRNKAFQEYRALSSEKREALKQQAYEAKDLSQVENKDAQIFALQDIAKTQVALVADLHRQLNGARTVYKDISAEILAISAQNFTDPAHQASSLAKTVQNITKILVNFAGTEQQEFAKEENEMPDEGILLD